MLGILMYAQDYDETLPAQEPCHRAVDNTGWPYGPGWIQDKVMPYIKNTQIFTCPSAPAIDLTNSTGGYSFDRRPFGACQTGSTDVTHTRSLAYFTSPSSSLMFTDGQGGGMTGWVPTVWSPDWNPGNDAGPRPGQPNFCCHEPAARHNDGSNCAYLDGHCKWQKETWY
jgi:prepilin-type processing-associated H-X9-DG protein